MTRVALGLFLVLLAGCAAPESSRALRVMTYNIKHGRGADGVVDLERIAAVIRAQDVDVVTLQEVDEGCARSGGVDQARTLGTLCGMEAVFGPFRDFDGGRYGMAVLSRHPIVRSVNHPLPPGPASLAALEARIRIGKEGPVVIVTGIHLVKTEPQRLAQAHALLDLYAREELPVILAGDFNSLRDSSVMRAFETSWLNPRKSNTFPAHEPVREIDYLLLRPVDSFEVRDIRVIPEVLASDHRPVLADLIFTARK